jgi:uncharacterized lipoprotein YddW (UPF0748 family)
MSMLRLSPVVTAGLSLLAIGSVRAEPFEVAAWVDHFDFAGVPDGEGGYIYDTEKPEGIAKILDYVKSCGATTVYWRICAGSTLRYPSKVDSYHNSVQLDKRRGFGFADGNDSPWGWVHYGDTGFDILETAMRMCRERGLKPYVHWPWEENHWALFTIGEWNFEHPQYWERDQKGNRFQGRCSPAYEQVREHKLAIVDELLDRGVEGIFIDFFRNGGWGPQYGYVGPIIEAWKAARNGQEPPGPNDAEWLAFRAGYNTEVFREMKEHIRARGKKVELIFGIPDIRPDAEPPQIAAAFGDWKTLVDDGIADTLVINYVAWDRQRPWESTEEICNAVMRPVHGRCRVLWPVRAYNFGGYGIPDYMAATGLPQPECAARLTRMAWENGADGISLECVDHKNYSDETVAAMRSLLEGECREVRKGGE